MCKTKTIGVNPKKAGPKSPMSLQQALASFKRISNMRATLHQRQDRRRVEDDFRKKGGNVEELRKAWSPDEFASYSDEELKDRERGEYKEFWDARLKGKDLFGKGWNWEPGCEGFILVNDKSGSVHRLYGPKLDLLLLLSEPTESAYEKAVLKRNISLGYDTNSPLDIGKTIDALHVNAVARLIQSLEGEQIARTIELFGYKEDEDVQLLGEYPLQKILWSLEEAQIEKLGDHFATNRMGGLLVFKVLEGAGEEGKAIIRKIAQRLREIVKWTEEQLHQLKGAGYE